MYNNNSNDFISRMPDDVLVLILGLLPIKEAVVISGLSTRWRFLWCNVTKLNFEGHQTFHNEVNTVIQSYNHSIVQDFRIRFRLKNDHKGVIDECLQFAVNHKVEFLELDLMDEDRHSAENKQNYDFPLRLVETARPSLNATVVEILSLKKLILKKVDVRESILEEFLSNCPSPETIVIHYSHYLNNFRLGGRALKLKHFEIVGDVYQGKSKTLMYDVTKILSKLKGKRGEHRVFRLAENLCMNLITSLREFFFVRKEGKGPTELTEPLNRVTLMTLAIIIKTRGISDAEDLLNLPTMLEQILATSQHTWSNKTLSYFPAVLREALIGKIDKQGLAIQAWQQAEATVLHQCTQLLTPPDDPTYVMTYVSHSFPQHRQYLCAGAWVLMRGHPENINTGNLGRVLREFSPDEVTANIYTMVDVLLHNIQSELQNGHPLQDLISNACENLAYFIWIHELLPPDILLLALIDRDDDPHALCIVDNLLERRELQQRIKLYVSNQGSPEHWLQNRVCKRIDLQKALGNHLSWKEKYLTYFDDIAARLLPVIPLIIYRLIENDAIESADRVLQLYSSFLHYYPLNFTFVRDILAYFYGHIPGKLIFRILNVLDIKKIQFSESFPQHMKSTNAICPPLEYFASLLLNLVNNVIPPLSNVKHRNPTTNQSGLTNPFESQKAFYQIQDPGTSTQLILETAVIEILSLPVSAAQIVSLFVQIIVIKPTLIQSNHSLHVSSSSLGSSSASTEFVSGNGYSYQPVSCVMIQACGLLLAQLPADFHIQLYAEASRVIKDNELNSAVGYALLDPTWAAQENTSTTLGNMVALLHALFTNLPHEWLDKTDLLLNQLRPVSSVTVLRIAFRIIGPLLPRLTNAHSLFIKTLELLLCMIVDVFGKNTQPPTPVEASDISDLIDFLHHVVHYEGQGGPVQQNSKPRADVLALCGKAIENMRSDMQHLLSHLKTDTNCSIYAATHTKLSQNPS